MSTEGRCDVLICQFFSVPPKQGQFDQAGQCPTQLQGQLDKAGQCSTQAGAVSVLGRIGSVRTKRGAAGTTTLMLLVSQPPSLDTGQSPTHHTNTSLLLVS